MKKVTPSMCLKVNRDTFFSTESTEGVYIRNNVTSLQMNGNAIDLWIEKLIPVFDGKNTLESLTHDLPVLYKNRVFEIAQVLYENNFVRDVSKDLPHQLPNTIINNYASQIEYLNSVSDSGEYRFQHYRESNVLAIGSGPLLLSLIMSLIKSGLPTFHIIITDTLQTDLNRIKELLTEARNFEAGATINDITPSERDTASWNDILAPFDSILYALKDSDINNLRFIQSICKGAKKNFMPIAILQDVAFTGPLVHSNCEGCWESAYRRLHAYPSMENTHTNSFSSIAGALLANVAVFELFKKITNVRDTQRDNQFYRLNLETLEGNWHTFLPHPLVAGHIYTEPITPSLSLIDIGAEPELDSFFNETELISKECGIFHLFEEEGLQQLPLSQCKVQTTNGYTEGPAQLLPEYICAGLTHEEARREAGLWGIESYIRCFSSCLDLNEVETLGIGAGGTTEECLYRALQNWIDTSFIKQNNTQEISIFHFDESMIEDKRSLFFLQALTTLKTTPKIYLGHSVAGFPVIWIKSKEQYYGSTGMNLTLAVRRALQFATMNAQNDQSFQTSYGIVASSAHLQRNSPTNVFSHSFNEESNSSIFFSALRLLKQHHKKVHIFELHIEPIFKEKLAGTYGLFVEEESS